jgi:hypothetical protein
MARKAKAMVRRSARSRCEHLAEHGNYCTQCGVGLKWHCQCGAYREAEDRYCPHCGTPKTWRRGGTHA